MMAASHCDCLICRLESGLAAELSDEQSLRDFRSFVAPSALLSSFSSAFELVRALHEHEKLQRSPSPDDVLGDLLRRGTDAHFLPFLERLLLLVFIPTIHRTTSQIVATFPSLAREDTAQFLFTVLLEFGPSQDLRGRQSHLAFTIARKIRRSGFRWAIREARRAVGDQAGATAAPHIEIEEARDETHAAILLQKFLDDCQRKGSLSADERDLLTQFKLHGVSGTELARRNGHSAVAIRHRIQRVLERLRRIARTREHAEPEQLNLLFP
ncbi:MAG: hypothetical protein WBD19_14565 [Candidatus Acidiferrum sp.]